VDKEGGQDITPANGRKNIVDNEIGLDGSGDSWCRVSRGDMGDRKT
jgi:hypothetical protein